MMSERREQPDTKILPCPNCQSPISPDDVFCGECGERINWSGVFRTIAPESLPAEAEEEAPAAPAGVEAAAPSPRPDETARLSVKISPYQTERSLREAYFELGNLLGAAGRPEEAVDAFRQADRSPGDTPTTADIRLHLADYLVQADELDQAVRAYLEASLYLPGHLKALLSRVQELLTPGAAVAHGSWILDSWYGGIEAMAPDAEDRALAALLLCRVSAGLADYPAAYEHLQSALELAPSEAPDALLELLVKYIEPTVAARKQDGNANYFLARAARAAGNLEMALKYVDLALELEVTGDEAYPEAPVQRLKAELLEAQGDANGSARFYYEAGRRYSWSDQFEEAIHLLDKARALNNKHVLTYWYLSDALRMLSYQPERKDLIHRSQEMWEHGAAIRLPEADDSWAYITRALIDGELADLPGVERWELWWRALAYLERAVLLRERDAFRWSFLARFHRFLQTEHVAVHAAGRAIELDGDSLAALEERGAILSNVGRFEEAEVVIDRRIELEPSIWAEGVKSYILYHQDRYEEALQVIEEVTRKTAEDPQQSERENIWNVNFGAYCKRALRRRAEAMDDYRWIWDRFDPNDEEYKDTFALAAYQLGHFDQAIELYTELLGRPSETVADTKRDIGWCYLATGELELGRTHLLEGIENAVNARQLEDMLRLSVMEVEEGIVQWPVEPQEAAALLQEIRKKTAEQIERVDQASSADEEQALALSQLREVETRLTNEGQTDGWAWVAVQAGMARLMAEKGEWLETAELYLGLQGQQSRFPEIAQGLHRSIGQLKAAGAELMAAGNAAAAIEPLTKALKFEEHLDRPDEHLMLAELRGEALIKAGEFDLAEEAFLEALTLPAAEKDEEKQAVQFGRLGYARFLNGDVNGARDGFARALHLFTVSGNPEDGKALSEVCQPLLKDVHAYWALSGEFSRAAEDHRMKAELVEGFREAQQALGLYLDEMFNLGPDAGEAIGYLPIVTPIAVEMAQDLVPAAVMEDSATPWHLIETLIPRMRDRILEDMGVEIPGVRIRGNEGDMSPGTYIIFIQDVPLVMGTVYADRHFVLAPQEGMQELEIPAEAVVASVNPVTGDPGVWVDPAYLEPLKAAGLEVWEDPLVYMIRHLEAVLKTNLALFLGIQDVAALLEAQKEEFDDPDLVRFAIPDRKSRLRFGQLLRALVSEQVPILALQDILDTVREIGLSGDDIHAAVRTVRQRLIRRLPALPGHLPQSALVWAPESFEQGIARWLMTHEEKVFFAIPPEETQELLNSFRELAGEQGDAFVLGVQDANVRPFARRLIELEFPRIHVVAAEELGT